MRFSLGSIPMAQRTQNGAPTDCFNLFDHPNFGPPTNYLSSLFGQSTQMLGASPGSGSQNGALNPLYQIAARDQCNWLWSLSSEHTG